MRAAYSTASLFCVYMCADREWCVMHAYIGLIYRVYRRQEKEMMFGFFFFISLLSRRVGWMMMMREKREDLRDRHS